MAAFAFHVYRSHRLPKLAGSKPPDCSGMARPGSFDMLVALAEDEEAFSMESLLGAANNPWDSAEAASLHDIVIGLAEDGEADKDPAEHDALKSEPACHTVASGEDETEKPVPVKRRQIATGEPSASSSSASAASAIVAVPRVMLPQPPQNEQTVTLRMAEPGHDAIQPELEGIDTADEEDHAAELEVIDTAEEEDLQEDEAAEPADDAMQRELEVTDTVEEVESSEVWSIEPAADVQQEIEFVNIVNDEEEEDHEGEASDTEAEDEEDHHPWSVKPGHWGRSHDLDWHERRRLKHEEACATLYQMPWQNRGPAPKAGAERPGFWRGQAFRAGTNRWANRGGRNKEYYAWLAKNTDWKGGKSSGKSSSSGCNKGGKPSSGDGNKGGKPSSGDGNKGGKSSGSGDGNKGGKLSSGDGNKGGKSSGSGDSYGPASELDIRPKWGKGPSGGK